MHRVLEMVCAVSVVYNSDVLVQLLPPSCSVDIPIFFASSAMNMMVVFVDSDQAVCLCSGGKRGWEGKYLVISLSIFSRWTSSAITTGNISQYRKEGC